MGSTEETIDIESNEEIISSSSQATNKVHPLHFETSHIPSWLANVSNTWVLSGILWIRPFKSIYIILIRAKTNALLPFGPLAILLHYLTGKHGWVFVFSLLGITPLAEFVDYTIEQFAIYTGSTASGLLNAIWGSPTEILISIYAVKNGMVRSAQQSLLGSIFSNMILVVGCAFFSAGVIYYERIQFFNKGAALVNSGLLLMAVMGLLFPTMLHFTGTEAHFGKSELSLSRFISCIMLVAYASYIFFQLKSQSKLYGAIDEERENCSEDSDEDEAPELTQCEAVVCLGICTFWISVLSGYLVDAMQGASDTMNLPVAFISFIMLPIAGNTKPIRFAMKDKLDCTLGVAIGSSIRISMFVIPFCVIVSWLMGSPMDLNFQLFETTTLCITVLVVAFMLKEGISNYFIGLMLILCYLIVAASFFVHVDPT